MNEVVRYEAVGRTGLITIDNPPVNAVSQAMRAGLVRCFEKAASDEAVDAVVLTCAGKTFIAGADLTELDGEVGEPGYHETLGRIEAMQKPVVAALHGTALGGGVEVALACHYRVASASTRLGFPEINLGLVPGAGGTQRLPRLIGVRPALEMFQSGAPLDAQRARETGLIDAIADGDLVPFAIQYAENLASQKKSIRRTCELPLTRDAATTEFLQAERERMRNAMPDRVVPLMDIDAVEAALDLPFADGLKKEREISDASLDTTESKAMRRLFFAERQTSRIPGVASDGAKDIRSGAIVGAGTMGRGIAMAFANSGIPVILLDVDRKNVDAGIEAIRSEYDRRVSRGRMSAGDAKDRLGLISGSVDYDDVSDADVVIEAVFESMSLKQQIFSKLDAHCKKGAVLASNTSTLDILEIASATSRPQDVVGLHFFSPAQVMRLLEVVRSDKTSDAVLATAMNLGGKLKKVAVLSANHYGFIGNRMMDPYGREAERLLLEGATPRQVDNALEKFGMAMGILAVFDMAGVDVGVRVREERKAFLPDDPGFYRSSALLVENGMLGQKSGAGFYRYQPGSRERYDNPEALAMFAAEAKRLGIAQRDIGDEEIVERCVYALVNEGACVLEEGVAMRAADVDVVYTSGYGFPRYRGGPMFYGDTVGLRNIVEKMQHFAATFDPQYWQASKLLQELADKNMKLADFSNT
jgi:3-hydroxyacyl-CoA dehydrogenase